MRNRLFAYLSLLLALLVPVPGWSGVEVKNFSSDAERERYQVLVTELRCPKCQNQNLADSNSPIAADLRDEIYRMLEQGKSDREIVDFLVARYGEFVLYKPPVKQTTLVLWLTPGLLVLIGLVIILLVRRRQAAPVGETALAGDEQKRLQALLQGTAPPDDTPDGNGSDR
ncbi:cytochrome c-type biogenesis protein [Porticoccus sp.]